MSQYKDHAESDEWEIEESKVYLYNVLSTQARGRDNAISGKELAKNVPQKYTTVKDMVQELLKERKLPVVGCNDGYFVVEDPEVLDRRIERLNEEIQRKEQKKADLAATFNQGRYE